MRVMIDTKNPKNDPRGRVLYPRLSLASHSCVANARYTGELLSMKER